MVAGAIAAGFDISSAKPMPNDPFYAQNLLGKGLLQLSQCQNPTISPTPNDVAVLTKYSPVAVVTDGTPFIYTISYTNKTTVIQNDVLIEDKLPSYLTFLGSSSVPMGTSNNSLSWKLPIVKPGETISIDIKVVVNNSQGLLQG